MKKISLNDKALAAPWPPVPASLTPRSIIALSGPTAGGKSAAALCLAQEIDAEIVCCDSMQIYRGLDIATAKPTPAEQKQVPHHLLDICEPNEDFSLARYFALAKECFEDIFARGKRPLLVGGSVLYLSALVEGMDFPEHESDAALRQQLQAELCEKGADALYARLAAWDPDYAAELHPHNHKRLLRALELQLLSGQTRRARLALQSERCAADVYDIRVFCLSHERPMLYQRIERRIDEMLEAGLVEECRHLLAYNLDERATCMQAIGYKEFFPYLRGEKTLAACTEQLKIDTRRYAKRQLSWFRAKSWPLWLFEPNAAGAAEKISGYLGLSDTIASENKT